MQRLSFCILILCFSIACALKCQTEDGVTEDDVRRIIRVCMRKIGENTYGENSSEYDDDSDEYGDDEQEKRSNRRNAKTENNYGQQLNQGSYWNNGRNFRSGGYGDYNNQYDYGRNGGDRNDRNVNRKNNSLTDKQTERDRACMVHCFFQEMKMVKVKLLNDLRIVDKVFRVISRQTRGSSQISIRLFKSSRRTFGISSSGSFI